MDMLEPGRFGYAVNFKKRYGNYIGGEWVPPTNGQYFENITPITGRTFCEVPRSTAEDIERALDAAHAAKVAWGKTSPTERANILNKVADRMEQNLELLANAETWDNGKPLRETMAADIPLAIDHFRYFAGCVRGQEGGISEIDDSTYAYHFHEPLGVVGQIIPWNFPILMAVWKLAPGAGRGQLRGAQAGRADAGVDPGAGRADRRPAAQGRAQHRQRLRAGMRQAAGIQQAHRQDRVHRRDDDRPADHAVRQPESDPGDAGTGRQVAERLLRRRDRARTTRSSTRRSRASPCSR